VFGCSDEVGGQNCTKMTGTVVQQSMTVSFSARCSLAKIRSVLDRLASRTDRSTEQSGSNVDKNDRTVLFPGGSNVLLLEANVGFLWQRSDQFFLLDTNVG